MRTFLVVLLTVVGATASLAEEGTKTSAGEVNHVVPVRSWALQVTPYVWGAGISGDISPFRRGPTIGTRKSFADVLGDLNLGGFINLWGRHERFVFSGDLLYVATTDSKFVRGVPVVGAVDTSVDSRQFTSTWQAGYRLVDGSDFTLDALGGLRLWHVSNDVRVRVAGRNVKYGEDFGWVDPVIGARAFLRVAENLSLQAQADVGGFGVGADMTWSALVTANYTFSDHLSVSAGYKLLDTDYARNGHVFETTLSGPVLGITYRF